MNGLDPEATEIPREVLDMVSADVALMYRVVPVRLDKKAGALTVAMPDPTDLRVLEDLRFVLGCKVRPVTADGAWLDAAIHEHYSLVRQQIDQTILECESYRPFSLAAVLRWAGATYHALAFRVSDWVSPPSAGELISVHRLWTLACAAPFVKLTNLIILAAIEDDASGLVLDLSGDACGFSFEKHHERCDATPLSARVARRVMRRIRRMARWARHPESGDMQGTIELVVRGEPIECRVSSRPAGGSRSRGEGELLRLDFVERRRTVGPDGEGAPGARTA